VGHFTGVVTGQNLTQGADNHHTDTGAGWLSAWFGAEVIEPVRLHVAAKRYLPAAGRCHRRMPAAARGARAGYIRARPATRRAPAPARRRVYSAGMRFIVPATSTWAPALDLQRGGSHNGLKIRPLDQRAPRRAMPPTVPGRAARARGPAAAGRRAGAGRLDEVDRAIEAGAGDAFAFLADLVRARSTVGDEAAAQELVAGRLAGLGFEVRRVPVPAETADHPAGGVAQCPYGGRDDVLGRINPGGSPSLLLNGHIDVVPAEAAVWSTDPFTPVTADGWLRGRGAGDMKGGFAMGALALAALRQVMPGAVTGELAFLSVIEEECTGNGTLAACEAGVLADAVMVLEPTGLELLLGGVGVLWLEIEAEGVPAHAEAADRAVNPVRCAPALLQAVADLGEEIAAEADDPAFAEVASPYNANVGAVSAGDWASSVPARLRLQVRVGFPRAWTADQAFRRAEAAVRRAAAADPWLAQHPPVVRPSGLRAEGYLLGGDHPLVAAVADAHASAHGARPGRRVLGSTTDARYYLNQFGVPALAYGPRARDIHAADEAVELASIVRGAKTLARFIAGFFASGGLAGPPGRATPAGAGT
jgi:acetylornithine deacetylase